MADGIMDDIGSVLTNPEVETILPTVLGAGGGLLSAPLGTGRRGAIGGALQGAAQGLVGGMRVAQSQRMDAARLQEMQQHLGEMKIQTAQLAQSFNHEQKMRPLLDEIKSKLGPEDQTQFQAMVDSGDIKGAFGYGQTHDPRTLQNVAATIKSVFPNEDPTVMDDEQRKEMFQAAIKVQSENKVGQMLPTEQGYYNAHFNPANGQWVTEPMLGSDGKPLIPMQMKIAQIRADTAAETRADKTNSVIVNGKPMRLTDAEINDLSGSGAKVEFPATATAEMHEGGTESRFDVTSAEKFLKDNVGANKPGTGWTYTVSPDDKVHWEPPPGLGTDIGITKPKDTVVPGAYEAWKKTQGAATKGGEKSSGGTLTPATVAAAEAKGYKFTGKTLPDGRLEIITPDGTKAAYRP